MRENVVRVLTLATRSAFASSPFRASAPRPSPIPLGAAIATPSREPLPRRKQSPLAGAAVVALVSLCACRGNVPREDDKPSAAPAPAAAGPLSGKTIAFVATDGVEEAELVEPRRLLAERGARTVVVAPRAGTIRALRASGAGCAERGTTIAVDLPLDRADPASFDGLVLPGGVSNADTLRADPRVVRLVQWLVQRDRVVAAIGHAPWLLVESGAVRDRTMTSWPSLKSDLLNAGAVWVDREVAEDKGVVTSRGPDDVEALVKKTTEALLAPARQQKHAER